MRVLIFLCVLLQVPLAHALLPEGLWYAENLVADDGSYGSFYKGWLFISDKEITQVITLGAHYGKTKFKVLTSDDHSAEIQENTTGDTQTVYFKQQADSLNFSFGPGNGSQYRRVSAGPVVGFPPASHPPIEIVSKWCVDQDCRDLTYAEDQGNYLFNMSAGFKPSRFWKFKGPAEFVKKYGFELNIMSYSYRLFNDGSQLSSFSTSLLLMAEDKTHSDVLAKSGVLVLRDGPLPLLTGVRDGHNIRVEFSIHRL